MLTGRLKKGLAPFFRYTQEDCDLSHRLIKQVGLDGLENRQISELSGGEFQRMLIARALAVSQKLLLLDEPTASVDVASWDQIFTLLAELNKSRPLYWSPTTFLQSPLNISFCRTLSYQESSQALYAV